MLITTNRLGPGWPKLAREGDLDLLIDNAAPEMEFFFWNQEELDFFSGYSLVKGKQFKTMCLWSDRWKNTDQRTPLGSSFVRIPGIRHRVLP